jgi:hypothetical protein
MEGYENKEKITKEQLAMFDGFFKSFFNFPKTFSTGLY